MDSAPDFSVTEGQVTLHPISENQTHFVQFNPLQFLSQCCLGVSVITGEEKKEPGQTLVIKSHFGKPEYLLCLWEAFFGENTWENISGESGEKFDLIFWGHVTCGYLGAAENGRNSALWEP